MLVFQLGAIAMEKTIEVVGNISGILGMVTCLVSGLFRLFGYHTFFNIILLDSMFIFGMGLMVFACMAKLHLLGSRK